MGSFYVGLRHRVPIIASIIHLCSQGYGSWWCICVHASSLRLSLITVQRDTTCHWNVSLWEVHRFRTGCNRWPVTRHSTLGLIETGTSGLCLDAPKERSVPSRRLPKSEGMSGSRCPGVRSRQGITDQETVLQFSILYPHGLVSSPTSAKRNWWMLRLSRSLSRFETQDIKTQPQFNHYKEKLSLWRYEFKTVRDVVHCPFKPLRLEGGMVLLRLLV